MASALPSTTIDLDGRSGLSAGQKFDRIITGLDKSGLYCNSNPDNAAYQMETINNEAPNGSEDISVDVTGITQSRDIRMTAKDDPDATEYSSSFADTNSGNDCSGLSDAEVESQFFGDNDLGSTFDGFSSVLPLRKKKLTSHWRNFIRPLMWRCKWAELRIKELDSQASKYAKCIAAYNKGKHTVSDQITSEHTDSKLLPFMHQSRRKKPLRRRKRKRVEDTTDITAYFSNHNLFSDRENKKLDMDGTVLCDDLGKSDVNNVGFDEFGNDGDFSFLQHNDNLAERILRKIELVHSRVRNLKAQLDIVMVKNAGKFSSSENLSQLVPYDAQTSSIHSPTFSACNGDTVSVGGLFMPSQQIPDYELGDFMMHEGEGYGEGIVIPDIIESTVGLLSAVDVTENPPQVGDLCETIVDNILVHNEMAELEGTAIRSNHNQFMEKPKEAENSGGEESSDPPHPATDPNVIPEAAISQEQPTLISCFTFPKNKRKRGERKAGSSNWSRQRPSETDGQ